MLGFYLALIDEPSDREKFEHLYYTYKDYMFNIAMSILHNENLADETVQDCFLKIAEKIKDITAVKCKETKALVSIMVKNKARNNLNLEHHDKFDTLEENDFISDNMVNEVLSKDGYETLVKEVKELDDTYRDILNLKFIYEYSAKEISELLHIPVRTVETRIYRGRKILKEKLEEMFNEYCD